MTGSDYVAVATRIAEALERIAAALEASVKPKEAARIRNDEAIPDDWLRLASRVLRGEKVSQIAKEIGTTPPSVRMKVLKALERRNPAKYAELRAQRDYGCIDHPSMRLLILHRDKFGF